MVSRRCSAWPSLSCSSIMVVLFFAPRGGPGFPAVKGRPRVLWGMMLHLACFGGALAHSDCWNAGEPISFGTPKAFAMAPICTVSRVCRPKMRG